MNTEKISLNILHLLPKVLIFLIKEDGVIVDTYGNEFARYGLEIDTMKGKLLSSLLHFRLETLVENSHDPLSVLFNDRSFDVYLKTVSESEYRVVYLYDMTLYSSVEMQLKESRDDLVSKKEELQAVFDLAANGISILDRSGMFLYANRFFQTMMGYTMEELSKESCISLSSLEYAEASKKAVEYAITHGSIQNFRKVCMTKTQKLMNASMSLSYLKNRDEILMITSDITQDIQYQEDLKRQVETEVAKRTEHYEVMCHQSRLAAMGEMIDSIAHQWRQPINTLGLIVQGMRHIIYAQGFQHELIGEIETEMMEKLNYMSQTIDDFSTFFRISKQKEKFNVLNGIEEAIRLIHLELKSHGIIITTHIEDDLETDVFGFPNEFRQVILNIVNNAMTAIISNITKNGEIEIILKSYDNTIGIAISDNGGGIDDGNIEHIFDPYYSTRENGSGIGLYMSKIIIEHHMQGRLKVENRPKGAEFTIFLQKRELL